MIYSEKKFEIGELSDGGCDIKFLHFHFLYKKVSRWLPERYRNYVRTYLLLHQDASFTASERIFLPFIASKIAKKRLISVSVSAFIPCIIQKKQ